MSQGGNMDHILDDFIFEDYVTIGVSAGPDSMCLLDILSKKTNKIIVCHINHNIRKESKQEEEFLKDYCHKHSFIFETMTITNYKENNFENEARKKRYTFYQSILTKYHSKYLLLAHHGDDLIETILMKIVRGSNLEGYAGIKTISKYDNFEIIRPLLPYTKEDILKYNNSHNIPYFIDSSNKNTEYTRNRYREKLLPLLKEEDPLVQRKFLKYSQTLEEYNAYIKKVVKENLSNIYQKNTINLKEFTKLDYFIQKNMLYYILNNIYSNQSDIITERHINNIFKIIQSEKPNLKVNLPHKKIIIKEYNNLLIKDNDNSQSYRIEFKSDIVTNDFKFQIVTKEESDTNNICRLDSSKIKLPLYLRTRKDGDYIILKTIEKKKKIKEIFIENKIPLAKRNTYPILTDSNDTILWIPSLKKSKFCNKKQENYDIIIKCIEREDI